MEVVDGAKPLNKKFSPIGNGQNISTDIHNNNNETVFDSSKKVLVVVNI